MKFFPPMTATIALISLLACSTKVERVELEPKLTLAVESRETLKPTIYPQNASDQTVTWGIDNAYVASIFPNGTVDAIAPGKATITVTTIDGGKVATCDLEIIPNIFFKELPLDRGENRLNAGDVFKLSASTLPENAIERGITWSSSDDSVATVDKAGRVKAISQGTATIAVTALYGGKTASFDLRVVLPVRSLTLDRTALTLEKGDRRTLIANISPVDATNQDLIWYSTNSSVADVDNSGNVFAKSRGQTTISVTAYDSKKSAECNVFVVPSDAEWIALVEEKVKWMNNSFAETVADFKRDGNYQLAAAFSYMFEDFTQKSLAHVRAFRTSMARGDSFATRRQYKEAIFGFYRAQINTFKSEARTMRYGYGNAAFADLWDSIARRMQRDLDAIQE